ncbi:hypothetical protein [Sporosarcina trichiuri]|uniref:hypothetical protein n=1 Tax=Sporosarcina trichiuri TaxID=3056445 RepID=UPI0025B29847|nr:hypothetical protein [Sporosarcina sp. 0.2-SM1T-5]WJY27466.1 hypothetical protein QWT68_00145 [Sporosarcina sp. 0.2-SM1T-5]
MASFQEAKQRKEYGTSVHQVLDSFRKDADNMSCVVVVSIDQNRSVQFGYAGPNTAEMVGITEVVKTHLIDLMRE